MSIDGLNFSSNLKKLQGSQKTNNAQNAQNGQRTQRAGANDAMSKTGSVFQSRQTSRTPNTGYANYSAATPSHSSSGNHQKSTDISNLDTSRLDQYSIGELKGFKSEIMEMLNGNIDSSTRTSLMAKRNKLNTAIQSKSMNSSATQASQNDKDETKAKETNGNNPTNTLNMKAKKEQDQEAAQKAYDNAQSGMGGIGLAATLAATVKETKAGEETKKATSLMESENTRMEKQINANNKEQEALEAKMDKLTQNQNKSIKKQNEEEARIQEQQNQMIQTSAEIEEMQGSYSVADAKTEDQAHELEKQFNTKVDAKSQTLTGQNTQINQSQRKISNLSKQYKNNIKLNSNYQNRTAQLNRANTMSMNVASSNITQASTTSGSTMGTAQKAAMIGQASSALGQSVSIVGQALEKNPYTASVGAAMHTYGDLTNYAGQATSAVSGVVQMFSSDTASAASTTTGSLRGATRSNRRIVTQGKSFTAQGKVLNTQKTTQTKSAQRINQEARTTFAASMDAAVNTKNSATVATGEQLGNISNRSQSNNMQFAAANMNRNIQGQGKGQGQNTNRMSGMQSQQNASRMTNPADTTNNTGINTSNNLNNNTNNNIGHNTADNNNRLDLKKKA